MKKSRNRNRVELYIFAWTSVKKFDLDADRPYGEYEKTISKVDYDE